MKARPKLWLMVAAPLAIAVTSLILLVPALRFSALIAAGRNYCPVEAVWSIAGQRTTRERFRQKLERAARIVRKEGAFVLWDVNGERYWMPADSRILPAMLVDQKTALYDSAGQVVKPGDVVLDCGANIGLYTLDALARGASLVVAIEPALDNVECLRRNLAGYVAAGRVLIYPKGVWDKDDVLPLNVQPSNSASYSVALRYRGAQPGPQVELTTIDELVRELGLQRVDYIKMDIEGAERAALVGGSATIRRSRPRLTVSLEHRYNDPTAVPQMVHSLFSGYRAAPGLCIETSASLRPAIMSFYAER